MKRQPWSYKRANVCLDDPAMDGQWAFLVSPTAAIIVANDAWNGATIPYFEKAEADKVMAEFNKHAGPEDGVIRFEGDAYIVTTFGEESAYPGFDLDFEGSKVRVYGIGACAWVWDEEPNVECDNCNKEVPITQARFCVEDDLNVYICLQCCPVEVSNA